MFFTKRSHIFLIIIPTIFSQVLNKSFCRTN